MKHWKSNIYHNGIFKGKNKVSRGIFCYYNSQYLGGFVRRIRTPLIILIAIAGILGFFQNCTPSVPFGHTDHFQSLVNSTEFPYEVNIDQVAYMSCSEQEDVYNDGAFFTFRFGAFRTHGIRVTPEYRNHIEKVDEEDVPYALQQSASSRGLKLQGAIRTMDNLQLMYVDGENGEKGLEGSDYSNFFPEMGDPVLSQALWYMNPNDYLRNYVAAQFPDEYRFASEVQFMKSQLMENDLRNFFGSRGILTVTFAQNGEIKPIGLGSIDYLNRINTDPNSPSNGNGGGNGGSGVGGSGSNPSGGSGGSGGTIDPGGSGASGGGGGGGNSVQKPVFTAANLDVRSNVFGAAVQPKFKQPPKIIVPDNQNQPVIEQDPGPDMPPRILSSVRDVIIDERLSTRPTPEWICPKELSFMIVLPEDAIYQDEDSNTITRCNMNPDPLNPNADEKKLYDIARQSIYAEDFYIDLRNRCVVPKPGVANEGSCYGINENTSMTRPIAYDDYDSVGCGFGVGQKVCPHYVSVCYRRYE